MTEPVSRLLYREALGLFIFTEVFNFISNRMNDQSKFYILGKSEFSDDGAVVEYRNNDNNHTVWEFEQVMISSKEKGPVTYETIQGIGLKHSKLYDRQMVSRQGLLIFLEKQGELNVSAIKDSLMQAHKYQFYAIWCLETVYGPFRTYALAEIDIESTIYHKGRVEFDLYAESYSITDMK